MILVAALCALVWFGGALLGWGRGLRWAVSGGIVAAALAVNLALPEGHALRVVTGGDARAWGILLFLALLIGGYRAIFLRIKARAADIAAARVEEKEAPMTNSPNLPPKRGTFEDAELARYARHMMLREIGGVGQKKLKQSRVLVIGAGGLGAPALMYLAAAGVGTIGIVDDDQVDVSNLMRQVIHTTAGVGQAKVASAKAQMLAINPHISVEIYEERLTAARARDLFTEYDIILDGTDNFDTRYLTNKAAVQAGKPLVAGALSQWEGQLSVWDPAFDAPCYQCVFPEAPAPGLQPNCAEAGVFGPLPGVIGTLMAGEALKLITGAGDPLRGRMMIWDALYADSRFITVERRPDCPCCAPSLARQGGPAGAVLSVAAAE